MFERWKKWILLCIWVSIFELRSHQLIWFLKLLGRLCKVYVVTHPHRNERFKHFFFNISKSSDGNINNDRYVMSYIIEKVEMYLECVSFSKFYSHRTNLLFVFLKALQEWALTESLRPRTKSSAWWVLSQRPSCPEAEKLEQGVHPFIKNLKSYLCKKI